MKIIDLLNKIANGKAPEKIRFANTYWYRKNGVRNVYYLDEEYRDLFLFLLHHNLRYNLNDEVEILNEIEEKEEKKIPEKLETIDFEKNYEYRINCEQSFQDIVIKINEIIDYLKSKGE